MYIVLCEAIKKLNTEQIFTGLDASQVSQKVLIKFSDAIFFPFAVIHPLPEWVQLDLSQYAY